MTTAATAYPLIGSQPVGNFFQPDSTQRHTLGATISVVDPFWGGMELIYLGVPTSTAVKVGQAVTWDTSLNMVSLPNTANLGVPVAFALNAVASNASSVQYSWFAIEGQVLALSGASVAAAAAIGITAAGTLGANSAGKQILNARVVDPATTTVAKSNVQTTSGSPVLRCTVGGTDGWFVGMAVSGTGIPASTTVSAVNPDNSVVMSANATATGAVTVTGTYNDGTNYWNVLVVDRPFAQGAIT